MVTKSVDDILKISPCLSLSQIRTLVNDETLRSIVIDGDYDVPTEDQTLYSPLESDRYLSNLTENDMIEYRKCDSFLSSKNEILIQEGRS